MFKFYKHFFYENKILLNLVSLIYIYDIINEYIIILVVKKTQIIIHTDLILLTYLLQLSIQMFQKNS